MPMEEPVLGSTSGNRSFETEQALMESLATLQAELAELRARPTEPAGDAGAEAIAELTAQIAALEAASAEAQRALERQLTGVTASSTSYADLEVASLTSPEAGTSGIGAEDAALAELERRPDCRGGSPRRTDRVAHDRVFRDGGRCRSRGCTRGGAAQ